MRRLNLSGVARILALLALIAASLPALGPLAVHAAAPPRADIPEITIRGSDFAFEGPAQIETGLVAITFVNDGKEPHQANLARLQDGKTMDDLAAAMQQDPNSVLALLEFVGGPNTVAPGKSQRVVISLDREGNYVLLCFVESPDGLPHVAKGMVRPLEVVARTSQEPIAEPQAAGTIALKDFAIAMPAELKAGKQTWKVTNEGPQPHELTLLRLAEGKTMDDVAAFFAQPAGAPPFEDAGGIGGLAAGRSGWVDLDLQPGNYIALCFIPDPASGKAHLELGMVTPFTVAGTGSAAGPSTLPTTGSDGSARSLAWLALLAGSTLLSGAWLLRRRADQTR